MSAFDQSRFQVRLDWGVEGVRRLATAEVYVVVDVLGTLSGVFDAFTQDEGDGSVAATGTAERVVVDDALAASGALAAAGNDGAAVLRAAASVEPGPVVLFAALRNATATARAVYDLQNARQARTGIALIAAGHEGRVTVEDQLAVGAVADALTALGIDHSAPDVAVVAEAFRALRRGAKHLVTGSGSGLALEAEAARDDVVAATRIDDIDTALTFRDEALIASSA